MISETQIILRVLVGAALGAVIGIERERSDQPAGLRTHMILVIGA
ncbi:MAG: MgtC/SapB family protein, partial [Brevefilum sp.]